MAEKTEAPTPKKREEARRRGQVARSVEINTAAMILLGFWVLSISGPFMTEQMSTMTRQTFSMIGEIGRQDFTLNTVRSGIIALLRLGILTIAPLLATAVVVGLIANLGQVGFMFSVEAAKPDFKRLNPLNGFKRIFSARSLVEFFKSILKITIVGVVVYQALLKNMDLIAATSQMGLTAAIAALVDVGITIGLQVGAVMVFIAAADLIFQRYDHERNLRMTKQEVREEIKRAENPELKSRIRARQRQMAMSRMMAAVPEADVVITNPTHIAVALRYDRGQMVAPQVVAKGKVHLAARIRETAEEHNVPLVEDKPLAWALYDNVEIGQEVSPDLYQAVAGVLAFVYQVKHTPPVSAW